MGALLSLVLDRRDLVARRSGPKQVSALPLPTPHRRAAAPVHQRPSPGYDIE
jgi:hypothetical protein